MKSLFLWLALLAGIVSASAQAVTSTAIRPLTIGDTVPDIELTNLINYPSKTARLSDFKGKLVILDFWAIWCGACISAFPKMDSLQKNLGHYLQIILVNSKNTGNSEKQVRSFLEKRRQKGAYAENLPILTEDTLFDKLFPHFLIPHYVWLDERGKVFAITNADEITSENITNAINNPQISLSQKSDIDIEQPIYIQSAFEKDSSLHYFFFTKGKQNGLPSGISYRSFGGVVRGMAITNMPIFHIYQKVFQKLAPEIAYEKKRVILSVKDTSNLIVNEVNNNGSGIVDLYSIDFITSLSRADSLYYDLLSEINRCSAYSGRIESRKVKCYVLTKENNIDKIRTQGGVFESKLFDPYQPYLQNAPISHLVARLNQLEALPLPVIDETNYSENIDIIIKSGFKNISTLRKELKRYGLCLIEVERELKMFVLSDK